MILNSRKQEWVFLLDYLVSFGGGNGKGEACGQNNKINHHKGESIRHITQKLKKKNE